MNSTEPTSWTINSQTYFIISLEWVKAKLIDQIKPSISTDNPLLKTVRSVSAIKEHLNTITTALTSPSRLQMLCNLFRLSPFEQDILLLCAGVEVDTTFASLFAMMQGDPKCNYPTFNLALSNLPQSHWSAISPDSPLRRWQLIQVDRGRTLTLSPLRIDERILNYLMGIDHEDEALVGVVKPLSTSLNLESLVPSHQALVQQLIQTCLQAQSLGQPLPTLQLCGGEAGDRQAIAKVIAAQFNFALQLLSVARLPLEGQELNRLSRRWNREAILCNSSLLMEWDDTVNEEAMGNNFQTSVRQFMENCRSFLILSSPTRHHFPQQTLVTVEVNLPSEEEQIYLWRTTLNLPDQDNIPLQQIVSQFNLSATMIQAAHVGALGMEGNSSLWESCRLQARPRMDSYAQRIESLVTWEDLILPELQQETLGELAAHLRQRSKVYQTWGFAAKSKQGLGITALFSGTSGTGKTLAASVLANELKLDLYKIDLSSVVSKYIGETEKNLSKVFDAAEVGGAILLFDEADALFGKRNEVKDSHDRYANMEVSYLLQRMEAYRGLAILTTNLPDSIDQAFLRRIRFIVQFPFPSLTERQAIWKRMFPAQTPVEDLSFKKLGRLNVAGGNIRNIALNAAFLAADTDEPVRMTHLLQAARREYRKLERQITDAEIRGWVEDAQDDFVV